MREKIYFYDGKININDKISLEGEEAHHLINVMRTKNGEEVCLFNGNGIFYFGVVSEINKRNVIITILKEEKSFGEPNVVIDVYQALVKGDKLSLIMQKITELGASNLFLFESKFCDVRAKNNKQERMDLISISASKQCKRASFVKSSGVFSIKEIAEKIKDYDEFFVAYENENGKTLFDNVIEKKDKIKKVAIMVGAEGGFSIDEIDLLKSSGANIVSLGKRILRTETASISSTALLSQILDK